MNFFRRKPKGKESLPARATCPYCGSINTGLVTHHGNDTPDYVRVWRGQRYLTCRCFACGRDFYREEPAAGVPDEAIDDGRLIDDEEALRRAEEELRKQSEDNDDRMFR